MLRITLAAAALGASPVNAAINAGKTSPLEKAAGLLEEIRDKVNEEGEAEVKQYNKFACFCKDTMASKGEAIETGRTEKDDLQAKLNEASSARGEADEGIADAIGEIDKADKEIEKLHAERKTEALEYEKNEVDISSAIQAISSALHELKAGKTGSASLAQLRSSGHIGMVRRVLLMAEVLGPEKAERASKAFSALQEQDVPTEQYGFHSDDIISTIEELQTEFKAQRDTLHEQDVAAKQAFHTAVQDQEALVEENQKAMTDHKTAKAEQTSLIATSTQDLTTIAATLLDDQKYLQDISGKCNEKATLWDQRTQLRANEISALSSALEAVKQIAADAEAEPSAFLQLSASVRHHQPAAAPIHAAEVKRHPLLGAIRVKGALQGRTMQVAAMLHAQGQKLHSDELMKLATAATEDPFAKVKTLIQELVERLLKEAADEASHKGWCDGELDTATRSRDTSASSVKEVNGRLAVGEARRAKLLEEVNTLGKEIDELTIELSHAEELRANETALNEASIEEAEHAKEGVDVAIDILQKYYAAAAKGEAVPSALIQKSSAHKEEPDAGFEGEYKGNQGASSGVIAMLEVVASDFQRTIDDTKAAEKKGKDDLLEMQTVNGASVAAKKEAFKAQNTALDEANTADDEDRQTLISDQERMAHALAEITSLEKACFDNGMTAEERKAKREEELEALKAALCILDSSSGGAEC